MNLRPFRRCPNCNCPESEELDLVNHGADGIEILMGCVECDFKCTFHYAYMGWTSEEADDESDGEKF